jgi:serine/threonine protein kinase
MDYIEGYSLAEVARLRPLGEREAAEYVVAITEAIQTAHVAGIVHRDLKPANILTDETAQPLITDFGLAKTTTDDSGMTASGKILGTPSYMPPEQIEQGEEGVGPRSDVYALGAIMSC